MKIFITGGLGFIGSNLANLLCKLGHQVSIFDNFCSGRLEYLSDHRASVIEGDILDFEYLKKTMAGHDTVVHLAAKGNVIESLLEPIENFNTNVLGTLNCLRGAADNKIQKFVFSSTGGALMGNTPPPVNELSLPNPISPYGASKLAAEGYCSAFAESYGLDVVILRFANVYGENSLHKIGVINKFFDSLSRNQKLTMYGNCSRDFIYVDDLIRGIKLAITAELKGCNTFHLANGTPVKISHLAKLIANSMGRTNYDVSQKPHRQGEVETTFAASKLAIERLGFECQTGLGDGIKRTIDWLQSQRSQ